MGRCRFSDCWEKARCRLPSRVAPTIDCFWPAVAMMFEGWEAVVAVFVFRRYFAVLFNEDGRSVFTNVYIFRFIFNPLKIGRKLSSRY